MEKQLTWFRVCEMKTIEVRNLIDEYLPEIMPKSTSKSLVTVNSTIRARYRAFIKSPEGNLKRILPPTKHAGYVA